MKLTDEQLEEARGYLRAGNLDLFEVWMNKYKVVCDKRVVLNTFEKLIKADCHDQAVKLFNAAFVGMNPQMDRAVNTIKSVGILLICSFIVLGSIISLLKTIF